MTTSLSILRPRFARPLLDGFAAVLLAAAALKAQSATGPTLAIAAVEATVAILIAIRPARFARRLALAMLAVFIPVAAYHLFAGNASCGCFGRRAVTPAWTLGFDCAMAAALLATGRPTSDTQRTPLARICGIPLAAVAIAITLSAITAPAGGPPLMLDAALAPGLPFPLLAYLAPTDRDALQHGDRTVVLYRQGCDRCADYIAARRPAVATVYINVPFDSSPPTDDRPAVPHPLRLPADRDYVVTVPVELTLHDGVIRSVRSDHADPPALASGV